MRSGSETTTALRSSCARHARGPRGRSGWTRRLGDTSCEVTIATRGHDELAALGTGVGTMVSRLAAEEPARCELIAAVSHDLRTPITALRLLAEAVDDGIVDAATQREYLGAPDDAGARARSARRRPVRALAPARRRHPLVARAGAARRARQRDHRRDAAARRGRSISVWASERAGERVEVEVADNGSGSPSAERERVFDAFFRSGAESSRSDGRCGLGLAISHAIIEAHGGTIADAALGTRVRFSLPRVRAATHSQRSRDRAAGSLDRPTGGG